MLSYHDSAAMLRADQLEGFFRDWPNPPSAAALLRILHGSDHVVLAIDDDSGTVIGLITAISDGVSCAYIPHLEVQASFRGHGIGSELVRRMLARLRDLYMIDLMCDADVQPFYARLGFRPGGGMLIRNYDRQACDAPGDSRGTGADR